MKKGGTAVRSKSSKRAKDQRGFKYFLWILPFLILVFLFSYFPLHGWIYAFLITNRQEAWQTVIL